MTDTRASGFTEVALLVFHSSWLRRPILKVFVLSSFLCSFVFPCTYTCT